MPLWEHHAVQNTKSGRQPPQLHPRTFRHLRSPELTGIHKVNSGFPTETVTSQKKTLKINEKNKIQNHVKLLPDNICVTIFLNHNYSMWNAHFWGFEVGRSRVGFRRGWRYRHISKNITFLQVGKCDVFECDGTLTPFFLKCHTGAVDLMYFSELTGSGRRGFGLTWKVLYASKSVGICENRSSKISILAQKRALNLKIRYLYQNLRAITLRWTATQLHASKSFQVLPKPTSDFSSVVKASHDIMHNKWNHPVGSPPNPVV